MIFLLELAEKIYRKNIKIVQDDNVVLDRPLSADIFESATGYMTSDWVTLIYSMYKYKY